MKLEILSPERTLYKGDVDVVTLPGTLGRFTILQDHAPMISSLKEGIIRIKPYEGEEVELSIKGGFVEVKRNEVSVCVE
ncbi:F-type H+-transporting ATPase subunit epsilon [Bacteroides luti]|jgi:F-type H+-transporting ATPase subunit epsilon|uniref:F-type H+-transporting ATPase subunit epsilon n=1 Tax=Bacteroides luti TaxID=1297750 RepID=A0A1M4TH27_9BACE|nr:ATP synthase F1 subunit epsilon [Bacteroides luti]SHE43783.1 F-type H+-transporting ATPase subunit epsilon [Bacteroides luti]